MATKKRVFKVYVDIEKQDDWLNQMSAEGWQLVRVGLLAYTFERGEPGAYIYRTQLLIDEKKPLASAKNRTWREYLDMLADSGAEQIKISPWFRTFGWVYLRRPATLGPFDLFSDAQSRLEHYERHLRLLRAMVWIMAILGPLCLAVGLFNILGSHATVVGWFDLAVIPLVALSLVAGTIAVRHWRRKIANLKQELTIHE